METSPDFFKKAKIKKQKEEGRTINIEQQYKELKNKYDELLHALEWIASIKRSEFLERPEFWMGRCISVAEEAINKAK